MTKTKEIGLEQRAQILGLHKHTTKSFREIARDLGVNHTTVSRIIKYYEETGSLSSKKRPGRPRKTTVLTDRRIRRYSITSPFISARTIKSNLKPILHNLSVRTIQRRLQKDFLMPAKK